ncbi:MAG: MFS transporter [Actinomycetota bacterium]|nr:MFS transporter [Actinomycetota bacterium]
MVGTAQAPKASWLSAIPPDKRRTVAGGAIGTLMEYFDYYLYGLASATVFPKVFFPQDNLATGTLLSFATFAFGFLLRPIGGVIWGHVGDRMGRKTALMITVVGMGLSTAAIGFIPDTKNFAAAPILLLVFRMLQGLFVGGEMGNAASLVVEHAPPGRRGLFGALLISGAGIANVMAAGSMAALGTSQSFFLTWGWRIPFIFSLVLAIIAIILRSKLEESEEFQALQAEPQAGQQKRKSPLKVALRHPKNTILGILIGLPQSIAGYIVLTFGLAFLVSKGTHAQVGFIGTMLVGFLQIFAAPYWGSISDKFGRRRTYIFGCAAFAILLYPTFALFKTDVAILIWLGMILGFVIPGVAMQATLQTLLCEMFDVEARTTGVNIGYQISNTIGGGFAPLIAVALSTSFNSIWPVIIYAAIICVIGIIATAYASIRPDVQDAPRLHEEAARDQQMVA